MLVCRLLSHASMPIAVRFLLVFHFWILHLHLSQTHGLICWKCVVAYTTFYSRAQDLLGHSRRQSALCDEEMTDLWVGWTVRALPEEEIRLLGTHVEILHPDVGAPSAHPGRPDDLPPHAVGKVWRVCSVWADERSKCIVNLSTRCIHRFRVAYHYRRFKHPSVCSHSRPKASLMTLCIAAKGCLMRLSVPTLLADEKEWCLYSSWINNKQNQTSTLVCKHKIVGL